MQPKVNSVVAEKACVAARVIVYQQETDGAREAALHNTLAAKFSEIQPRSSARTAKPLLIPGNEPKLRHQGVARAHGDEEHLG